MVGYTFVFGVDGFGADVAPAYEEGVFLNYNEAYERFKELTKQSLDFNPQTEFYEEGWSECEYPKGYEYMDKLFDEDEEAFEAEMEKHILKKVEDICDRIMKMEELPCGFYQLVEVEII